MKAKVTHEDVRDDRFPCTCTIACIPQGIAADQKCRLADIDENQFGSSGCSSTPTARQVTFAGWSELGMEARACMSQDGSLRWIYFHPHPDEGPDYIIAREEGGAEIRRVSLPPGLTWERDSRLWPILGDGDSR